MSIKLKPSTKEYKRDARGKMTNKWTMKHYPPSGFKSSELKDMYGNSAYTRKKHLILIELKRRGIEV